MNSENNVVSLFEARKKQNQINKTDEKNKTGSSFDVDNFFADIMKKNQDSKSKASQDRLKSNKSVLRSYRIKDK